MTENGTGPQPVITVYVYPGGSVDVIGAIPRQDVPELLRDLAQVVEDANS